MLNITDRAQEEKVVPVLRLGFRPFFMAAGIYAALALMVWMVILATGQQGTLQVPALWWHVHEMIFGFAMAVVAGFVLTAVQTWTGQPGTKSWRLLGLVALWVTVRVLFWLPVDVSVLMAVESLFLILLAWESGIRVVRAKRWRNVFFIPLFLLAAVVNIMSYAAMLELTTFSASDIWQAMLWWFCLLLSVMGGRVIPFFSAKRHGYPKPEPLVWLEWCATLPLVLLLMNSLFGVLVTDSDAPLRVLMIVAGVFQCIRFARWQPWRTLSEPLVWSLHVGYLCIPLSLLVRGLTDNAFAAHTFLHLFAIGALGGVILAMMARVTMGHTGRNIYQGPTMWPAFIALLAAALIRSVGVALFPIHMMTLVYVAGGLWVFAFVIFCWRFIPMLVAPRVDGMPG